MRDILFSAKRFDNGEWVEGTPFQEYSDFWGEWQWIIQTKHPLTNAPYLHLEVNKKTLRQFTGLNDKNGKKIFEGDIVRYMQNDIMVVVWNNESAAFVGAYSAINFNYCATLINGHMYLEVIGNIYDNPELLEDNNND